VEQYLSFRYYDIYVYKFVKSLELYDGRTGRQTDILPRASTALCAGSYADAL